jgi:pimeloyl-ACP methyl ester carboxylesterase
MRIPTDSVELEGTLEIPENPIGVVLFVHGSGSSRLSPRNVYVAQKLLLSKIGTLLFDLLTEREAQDRKNVFDIKLLSERLLAATAWIREHPVARDLSIGYFGASTGAAAALIAAANDQEIDAVVSRGGRPDLAGDALRKVRAPTLLIVGSLDEVVIELNRQAYELLPGEKKLVIVPGATHLFEEPGTLDEVVRLATNWFLLHLKGRGRTPNT